VLPPAAAYFLAAAVSPFLPRPLRRAVLVLAAAAGLSLVLLAPEGDGWRFTLQQGIELTLLAVDPVSRTVGSIFALVGLFCVIYTIDRDDPMLHAATCGYLGAAVGLVFSGDFFSLVVFWELMAIFSLLLIWNSDISGAGDAGMRYLYIHVFGGGCLIGGIALHLASGGPLTVGPVAGGAAALLLITGIGVNAAFIPLHTWVPDAYPKASVWSAVFLCILTTKSAVYVLARTGSGLEAVAWMGGIMCVYGAFYALLQDDIRGILSYSIISQVGLMTAAVGVGTPSAIDAAIAHLANDVAIKALLFMGAGAVILATGAHRLQELGGLARRMPLTAACCAAGGLAMAGVPPFGGFVSKGLVIAAVGEAIPALEILLLVGAAGTVLYVARFLYYVFLAGEPAPGPDEAPPSMIVPMVSLAVLCLVLGTLPDMVFDLLSRAAVHHAYAPSNVAGAFGIAGGALLVFVLAGGAFTPLGRDVPDLDALTRRAGAGFLGFCTGPVGTAADRIDAAAGAAATRAARFASNFQAGVVIAAAVLARPLIRRLPGGAERIRAIDRMRRQFPEVRAGRWDSQSGVLLIALMFLLFLVVYLVA